MNAICFPVRHPPTVASASGESQSGAVSLPHLAHTPKEVAAQPLQPRNSLPISVEHSKVWLASKAT
ncbi:hypothetical protein BDP81DRAFT_422690 [Colletotrichum phormii]|uniref:Uncharacterized protein n=1 Tax=Colletotrichum phormii TaxID=359342 RepID=A0AAI9ZVW9_9PEZI|nr:uncharacterized protein BDP81DRAFT_422690 [Colletotrichum phormii]KAK1638805.1 hypothetical protein BDP81DRAFT_422690 [Colletotrichum phormii]